MPRHPETSNSSIFMATKTVTDASFQADVLDSETPVLVDFWADWCGPCKMIAPALEEISDELAGKVTIADRKSTLLNSSHVKSSYAVFCLKKKNCEVREGRAGAVAWVHRYRSARCRPACCSRRGRAPRGGMESAGGCYG